MRAATGFSRKSDAAQAAREALAQARAQVTEPYTVWAFASHHHADHLPVIAAELGECILGTSYGVLTEAGETEEEPGLAVLLVGDPALRLNFWGVPAGGPLHDGELGKAIAERMRGAEATWLFLDRDCGWPESVAQAVPGLVAGAGTQGGWPGPTLWLDGAAVPAGVWAVGLHGARSVEWTLAQALAPLGGQQPVTRVVGDRLFSLGGKPAARVAEDILGAEVYQAVRKGERKLYLRAPGERADRLFAVDGVEGKTEALFVPGLPEETASAALAIYDGPLAKREFAAQLEDLRQRCPEPAFAVYVNCCARGVDLYGEPDVDATLFRQAFPGVPLLGLSGSFELAPGGRLCSYTGVLIAVS